MDMEILQNRLDRLERENEQLRVETGKMHEDLRHVVAAAANHNTLIVNITTLIDKISDALEDHANNDKSRDKRGFIVEHVLAELLRTVDEVVVNFEALIKRYGDDFIAQPLRDISSKLSGLESLISPGFTLNDRFRMANGETISREELGRNARRGEIRSLGEIFKAFEQAYPEQFNNTETTAEHLVQRMQEEVDRKKTQQEEPQEKSADVPAGFNLGDLLKQKLEEDGEEPSDQEYAAASTMFDGLTVHDISNLPDPDPDSDTHDVCCPNCKSINVVFLTKNPVSVEPLGDGNWGLTGELYDDDIDRTAGECKNCGKHITF
jgi:hypothetical protein